jgi:hypothetical protein
MRAHRNEFRRWLTKTGMGQDQGSGEPKKDSKAEISSPVFLESERLRLIEARLQAALERGEAA